MDDLISRQAAIDALGERPMVWMDSDYEIAQRNQYDMDKLAIETVPSAQPEPSEIARDIATIIENERDMRVILKNSEPCDDAVPRASVEYICRKNTVSTNPYEHKYHDKFIQFLDDPEISDFGRWQHSNGFNTALVAVKCDLDKVPSVTPKQRWIPCGKCIHADGKHRWCKVLDRSINEDYFCCWAEPIWKEGNE